jgi:hypothetical protein
MKREQTNVTSGGGGGVPFSGNLIFHAPLTQGDWTDHISGVTPVLGTGSCTWDSTYNAYRFTCIESLTAQKCLIYDIPAGIDFKQSENYNFSIYAKIRVVSQAATTDYFTLGVANSYSDPDVFTLGETHRFNAPSLSGAFYDLCMTRDTRDVVFYVNKSVSRTSYWEANGNFSTFNVAKAVANETNKRCCIGTVLYNYTFDTYIKDVRIYDRVLSASEVAQL